MRTLPQLLASSEGRGLLEARGVLTEERSFVEVLRAPAKVTLAEHLGLGTEALPVYAAHQIRADYVASVISKIRAAVDLQIRNPGIAAVLLWLDMDRAGADKRTAGLELHGRGGSIQTRLASRRHDDKEIRFVPVVRAQLEETVHQLEAWARQHGTRVAARYAPLTDVLLGEETTTLAKVNFALTSFLVREHLGLDAPAALVSDLVSKGLLTEAVDQAVDRIDDFVTVFNAEIDSLASAEVDPLVRHLGQDYLPLHYSCDRDDRRCKLIHERRGADHFAVTTCACGTVYRFHLGSGSLSIRELAATGRWSTDVTLPLYLNDLASGLVAGQSSALYGLVLNEVLGKVLDRRPIPMLVPEDLAVIIADGPADSLVAGYLGAV